MLSFKLMNSYCESGFRLCDISLIVFIDMLLHLSLVVFIFTVRISLKYIVLQDSVVLAHSNRIIWCFRSIAPCFQYGNDGSFITSLSWDKHVFCCLTSLTELNVILWTYCMLSAPATFTYRDKRQLGLGCWSTVKCESRITHWDKIA